jgi:hypothetical protein
MHFCTVCNNMYYVGIDGSNGSALTYYCRNCGDVNNTLAMDSVCVSKTTYQSREKTFGNFVNEFTKYDPTLPRINNIPCANEECSTNHEGQGEENREILLVRYDNINMKFLYLCAVCDKVWI